MDNFWRSAANVFYGIAMIGGLLAAWIVVSSFMNMGQSGGPDFSAVIAVTLPVIPYCIARSLDGMLSNDLARRAALRSSNEPTCRYCAKPIAHGIGRCPHCNVKLN